MSAALVAQPAEAFRHEAVVYGGDDEFVDRMAAFLRQGIASGEASLALVAARKIDLLRGALGHDAEHVEFADMERVGANPAHIIPVWRDFVDRHAATGGQMRGIGEPVWRERTADELVECQRHEALINVAFTGAPMWLVCPYDRRTLSSDVVEAAHASHPIVSDGVEARPSTRYAGIDAVPARLDDLLPSPPLAFEELTFAAGSLAQVRRVASRQAALAGLRADRIGDAVAAVHEVAANSIRHGGGRGVMRTWRDDGGLVCEVRDAGQIDDPLIGRVKPAPGSDAPRGMWVVHQLCDLVQLRSSSEGTVVRMRVRASR